MRKHMGLGLFVFGFVLWVSAPLAADGSKVTTLRVEIDESVDGKVSPHNYTMYLVTSQLEKAGFKVSRGRSSAWAKADSLQVPCDMILRGNSSISLSNLSVYYGDTVAVMHRRIVSARLLSAADTTVVLAKIEFDETKGVARENQTVKQMFARSQKEAQTRAGNILSIELFRSEPMQKVIPAEHKARIDKMIKSFDDVKNKEKEKD